MLPREVQKSLGDQGLVEARDGTRKKQCLNPTHVATAGGAVTGEATQVKGDFTGLVTTQRDGQSEDTHRPIRICPEPRSKRPGRKSTELTE